MEYIQRIYFSGKKFLRGRVVSSPTFLQHEHDEKPAGSLFFHLFSIKTCENPSSSKFFIKREKKIPGIRPVDTNRPRKLLIRKIPFIYLSRGSEHELREQTNVIINSRVNEGSIHSIRCIFSTIFHYITIQSILENTITARFA